MTLVLVVITVIGLALFVIVPAVIFYTLEDWTFGEAVYCCFVTVLTIGWADFVPGRILQEPAGPAHGIENFLPGCSRSFEVTDFDTNQKHVYDLVNNMVNGNGKHKFI